MRDGMEPDAQSVEPLFVACTGRAGSTLLMHRLAAHPSIAAYRGYPLEVRAFQAVVRPGVRHGVSGSTRAPGGETAVIRALLAAPPRTPREAREVYRRIGAAQGKRPCYGAEKCKYRYAAALRATYPRARFIVLVRDPRDVIVSVRAFDARRGHRGFFDAEGDTDEDVVRKVRQRLDEMTASLAAIPHHLVRYEDLVRDPDGTMAGTYAWLGLPDADSDAPAFEQHRTAASSEASIERWRTELAEPLLALCNRSFAPVLRALGYAADARGSLRPAAGGMTAVAEAEASAHEQ